MTYSITRWKLRKIVDDFRDYLEHVNIEDEIVSLEMGITYDLLFADINKAHPLPNRSGLFLMAMWSILVTTPIMIIRQRLCNHENMVCEGYGGPDSGYDAGHCPDCGWAYHVVMY